MLESWNKGSWGKWALLPLRLIIGYGFMAHGFAKLSRGPEEFAGILQTIGVPAPRLMAWLTALVEFFGGLAIIAGALVAIVSIPLAITMLVAMFTVHLPYGFSTIKLMGMTESGPQFGTPGYEMNLLYIAGLLTLVLGGMGPLSIDRWLAHRKSVSRTSYTKRNTRGSRISPYASAPWGSFRLFRTSTEPPRNVILHNDWENSVKRVVWVLRRTIPAWP